jgi:transposase InsO family protein
VRKTNKATAKDFTAIENLAALSWTAATAKRNVRPNEIVAVDWGIINETSISGKNYVFVLYLDLNTCLVFTYPAPSRGLAGPSLQAYIQRYGPPATILSDNAKEFTSGEFAEICKTKEITQKHSASYNPNQNPVEHYMEIISSKTRSLLAISGLDPDDY